jgi:hypothetical protein
MHSTKNFNFNLVAAAHADMIEHGFQPDFPQGTDTELAKIEAEAELPPTNDVQDLRGLPMWMSGYRAEACWTSTRSRRRPLFIRA